MNCTECDDNERSQNAIKELKHTHARMTTVLNELEVLEDGYKADYSELVIDYRWIVSLLEQRRERLQSRGRCL
jgi:hypothetical protein